MKVIRLAGLWKKKDKEGNLLLNGDLNETCRVLVVRNAEKTGEGEPDYFLCIGPKGKKGKGESSGAEEHEVDDL